MKARVEAACVRAGREANAVTIVAVSKNRSVAEISEAVAAGAADIGENRVQEALLKFNAQRTKWHMIGHLQTNKAKEAVKIFDLIHSVDSLKLAQEIDKQAAKIDKVQDVLIEVKTSPEATKSGILPQEAGKLLAEISGLKNIAVKGLMTIAPLVSDSEEARSYFKQLKELRDKINSLHITPYTLHMLSMGMTDDFEVAIEEGATMIRVGRAIFGS